jgi:CrcB protein
VLGAIAAGGALGAPARYGVAQLVAAPAGAFPWATFVTNVSGSLALGVILTLVVSRFPGARHVGPFLTTGFLGAYTTYSTFAVETDQLVTSGHAAVAGVYAGASLGVGLAAAAAGIRVARALSS